MSDDIDRALTALAAEIQEIFRSNSQPDFWLIFTQRAESIRQMGGDIDTRRRVTHALEAMLHSLAEIGRKSH